eukprot:TRINITY_DN25090_c3_g1_i1.p1 TRINITY_DN25090_c3_g1~~TRINITY_DN25090_c3_g1_i1.p1  ORF type:complete len:471 (+),score=26.21 TRINITY_DN25090_c3_g1_i1:89-1501(+)
MDAQQAAGSAEKERLLPRTIADDKYDAKQKPMTGKGMAAALSYMLCAVTLVMFNKAALSAFNFPCANVITLLQMLCSLALLAALRLLSVISFADGAAADVALSTRSSSRGRSPSHSSSSGSSSEAVGLGRLAGHLFAPTRTLSVGGGGSSGGKGGRATSPFVPMQTLLKAAPLSVSYLLYMVVGMASIRGVSVPMYTALRRTTVAFTLLAERLLAGQRHSAPTLVSVAIIVAGALIAGVRDLSFDAYGYGLVFLSNLTTAIYLAFISRLGKATGLNSFGLMWCNSVICTPALLLWTYCAGEIDRTLAFPQLLDVRFIAILAMSCAMAFTLNYTIFLNTALNSALTQTMCGNLKDLGTVGIGWALFGGLPFDFLNVKQLWTYVVQQCHLHASAAAVDVLRGGDRPNPCLPSAAGRAVHCHPGHVLRHGVHPQLHHLPQHRSKLRPHANHVRQPQGSWNCRHWLGTVWRPAV